MHKKSILRIFLLAASVLLTACASSNQAPAPTTSPSSILSVSASFMPSSMLSSGSFIPKNIWDSPARVDAQLRTLLLGYLDAVKKQDAAAMQNHYLSAHAYEELLGTCTVAVDIRKTPWVCVKTLTGQPVITGVKTIDTTHAEITVVLYDNKGKKLGEPLVVPAVTTRDGPRLDDGRLK